MKKKNELPALNQTEETVMQAVWSVKQGFVGDIIKCMPEPKLPYNTVVTAMRNLEKKGYVGHETFVNANRYFPTVDRKQYIDQAIGMLVKKHFNSSYSSLLSFFVEDNVVDEADLVQALQLIKQHEKQEGGKQ